MKELRRFLHTPLQMMVAIALVTLMSELSIMLLIGVFQPFFKSTGSVFWTLIDPVVLTALVSPALYILIFMPMRKQQIELESHLDISRRNEQLTALIEAIPDAVFLKDGEGRWLIINQLAEQLFQLHNIPWQDKTEMELADLQPAFRTAHEGCLTSDEKAWQARHLLVDEESLVGEDGRCTIIEARKMPMFDEAGRRKGLAIIGRDITERKASGARIERLTKLYQALSEVNQAIVRMDDASTLFPLACRIAVDFGGLEMAWVGQLNEANGLIEPVVNYGRGVEYLHGLVISSKEDSLQGRGPSSIAFRENRNVIIDDFQLSEMTKPWHDLARRYNFGSSGFFPIPRNGKPYAVFAVYHSHPGAFDTEMIGLLDEMSRDISFALDSFNRESERRQMQEALLGSERHFRAYFERSMVGMATTDPKKDWLEVNDALCQMLGYSHEELMRLSWTELTHPSDIADNEILFSQVLSGKIDEYTIDKRFIRKDGSFVYVHLATRAVRRADGSLDYMVTLIEDITERKQQEAEIQASEERLSTLLDAIPDAVFLKDGEGRWLVTNEPAKHMFQLHNLPWQGKTEMELAELHPAFRAAHEGCLVGDEKAWQAGQLLVGEEILTGDDGSCTIIETRKMPLFRRDGQRKGLVVIGRDMTERRKAEERIQHLAHFDQLTGLPNRVLFTDRINHALSMAQRSHDQLAVLFLDLDHFKNINDTLGHSIGDALLIEVALRLKLVVRQEDTVSRQGGDEFILVLPGTGANGAAHMAEKLLEAISHSYQVEQYELNITSSIGIAIYPDDGEDFELLYRCVDIAMYRAKQEGRNNYRFFTQEMQTHSARTLKLENALRYALERNQLRLHYQPQTSLQDGRVIGAEALLRWQHPELGAISPTEFIPIAENSGQILQIGEWVLRTAIRQLKTWMDSGLVPMIIAVNLSAVQFRHPNLPKLVTQILEEMELPPQYLELELTESVAMDDPLSAIAVMNNLHERGIRMSIDDFGTGFSSLSYLKKFKVYKLKIDQSFVRDISDDPEDKAIVAAIISLASSLGMQTIAEGVETARQLTFLRNQGCNEVQGYYFSKPLPAEQFEVYIRGKSGNLIGKQ